MDGEQPAAKLSDRGTATKNALLAAARDVFIQSGFAQANVTDVVARAGASVGSLYHHFNGKADLFTTLFDDFQLRQQERTSTAIRGTRDTGEGDPLELFVAGARAYLEGCFAERDLVRIFRNGDGPPGFDLVARRRLREWARRNAALLSARGEGPYDDAIVLIVTSTMAGLVNEVALSDDEQRARDLSEEVLDLMGKLGYLRSLP